MGPEGSLPFSQEPATGPHFTYSSWHTNAVFYQWWFLVCSYKTSLTWIINRFGWMLLDCFAILYQRMSYVLYKWQNIYVN